MEATPPCHNTEGYRRSGPPPSRPRKWNAPSRTSSFHRRAKLLGGGFPRSTLHGTDFVDACGANLTGELRPIVAVEETLQCVQRAGKHLRVRLGHRGDAV